MSPSLSIIIPTFNGENFLGRNLESIKKCRNKNKLEIIAVDNNSNDKTLSILEKFQNDLSINIIKNSQNFGFAKACNIGASKAKHDFLFITNQDMIFPQNFFRMLEQIVQRIKKNSKLIISPAILFEDDGIHYFGAKNHVLGFSYTPDMGQKLSTKEMVKKTQRISGGSLFINKNLFLEMEGFDELFFMYYEDTDFSLKCLRKGLILYTTNKPFIIHQKHKWELTDFTYFLLERNRYLFVLKNINGLKKLLPFFLILEFILIIQSFMIKKFSIRIRIYYQLFTNLSYLMNLRKHSRNFLPLMPYNKFSKELDPMIIGEYEKIPFFKKSLDLVNLIFKFIK